MNRSVRFSTKRHGDLQLNVTDFPKAMATVQTCVDDLHRSLGIDPALLSKMKSAPVGYSFDSIELPEFFDKFEYKLLYWVTADGKVDECHLLAPTGKQKFDQTACAQLIKNGRLKPALDSEGRPMRAPVYENPTVRRIITRS